MFKDMFTVKERKDRIRRNSDMTINESAQVDFQRQSENFKISLLNSSCLLQKETSCQNTF